MPTTTPAVAEIAAPAEARAGWLWRQQDQLVFKARVSAAYHARREHWLAAADRLLGVATAFTATGAYVDFVGQAKGLAALAALASVVMLVMGLAAQARAHGQLKMGWRALLSRMQAAPVEWDEAQLRQFRAQAAELEEGEGAPFGVVVIQCENDILAAERKPIAPLRIWERALAHLWPFDAAAIVARMPRQPSL